MPCLFRKFVRRESLLLLLLGLSCRAIICMRSGRSVRVRRPLSYVVGAITFWPTCQRLWRRPPLNHRPGLRSILSPSLAHVSIYRLRSLLAGSRDPGPGIPAGLVSAFANHRSDTSGQGGGVFDAALMSVEPGRSRPGNIR